MSDKVQMLPLGDLHFDPLNPRLPTSLHDGGDDAVLEYLLLECNAVELMESIGEKGYFPGEPLLAVPRPDGGYWVVEGNRRLGALKLLQSDTPAPVKPREVEAARAAAAVKPLEVPALVFPRREDILGYLGYRHITGIKEWGPLAKARYLRQLRDQYGPEHVEAHKALARTIGSKSTNVAKLLTGLALLERARDTGLLRAIHRTEDDIEFSLLTTGIGYGNIQAFIGLNGIADVDLGTLKQEEFNEFFRWVFEKADSRGTYLGESRKFGKLNEVVAHAQAMEAVRRGELLDTAYLYTSGPLQALREFMHAAEKHLRSAQESCSHVTALEQVDADHAQRLSRAAAALSASIKAGIAMEADVDADS